MEVLATLLRRLRRGAEPGVLRHLFFFGASLLLTGVPRGAFLSTPGAGAPLFFVQSLHNLQERRAPRAATARSWGRVWSSPVLWTFALYVFCVVQSVLGVGSAASNSIANASVLDNDKPSESCFTPRSPFRCTGSNIRQDPSR